MSAKIELIDLFTIDETGSSTASWTRQDVSEIPDEVLNESKVDRENVIGRLVGECFAVDGKSGNKRFYPRKLWESAISKTASTTANGMMLGTIGHKQPIDEKAILEGKISHRMSRLWIDESTKKGMGEILILNTDSGRNLNALLKSGSKIPVSSRAFGDFDGKTNEGYDIVNPSTYELIGFDFVINPGIATAIPNVVESLITPENSMSDNQLLTTLTEEKIQLNRQITEAKATIETMKGRAELAEAKLETATNLVEKYKSLGSPEDLKSISENFNEVNTAKLTLEGQVVAYKYLGTPEEIEEVFSRMEQFTELGSVAEVSKCLDVLESYTQLGNRASLQGLSESLNEFTPLGTAQEIEEALEGASVTIKLYEELGTVAEVDEALDTLEQYVQLGTPAQVQEALTRALTMVKSIKEDKTRNKMESLAAELNVPKEVLESLSDKSEAEIRTIVTAIGGKGSKMSERYAAPPKTDKPNLNETQEQNNGNENRSTMDESRSGRLMGRFSS